MKSTLIVSTRFSMIIMFTLSLVLSVHSAIAQQMRMSAEDRAKRLKEQLSLDNKQTEKVKKIYEDGQAERMKIFENAQGDREAMREAMTKMIAKQDKQIERLLTGDQKKKYEEIKKERMSRMGGRRGNNEGNN